MNTGAPFVYIAWREMRTSYSLAGTTGDSCQFNPLIGEELNTPLVSRYAAPLCTSISEPSPFSLKPVVALVSTSKKMFCFEETDWPRYTN